MLKETLVEVKWNSKTKKHYVDLGYVYTKMGDIFLVNSKDLTSGSNVVVTDICDYCNNEYNLPNEVLLRCRRQSIIQKDCCPNCRAKKQEEGYLEKYGVENLMQSEIVKDNHKKSIQEKYGCDNVFQNENIKSKSKQTCLEKYGVENYTQTEEYIEKSKNTCIKKYGVDNYSKTDNFISSFSKENSPRWKGGAKTHGRWRNTQENREWRKAVYERDDYICQCCGKRGYKLNAHHIFNFAKYIDLRFNIDNGITFCEDCHKLFHHIYGLTNDDKQLDEFLKLHGKKVC